MEFRTRKNGKKYPISTRTDEYTHKYDQYDWIDFYSQNFSEESREKLIGFNKYGTAIISEDSPTYGRRYWAQKNPESMGNQVKAEKVFPSLERRVIWNYERPLETFENPYVLFKGTVVRCKNEPCRVVAFPKIDKVTIKTKEGNIKDVPLDDVKNYESFEQIREASKQMKG